MDALDRFRQAQDAPRSGFDVALSELRRGRKQSHWAWYIFPQLRGLGSSPAAEFYGLAGVAEAEAYLRDGVLRSRLLAAAGAARAQADAGVPLDVLMGSDVDVLKLVSSMTLFGSVARRLSSKDTSGELQRLADIAEALLAVAGRDGVLPCAFTRAAGAL